MMQKEEGKFRGYQICSGDEPLIDVAQELSEQLNKGKVLDCQFAKNYQEEEKGFKEHPAEVSTVFERTRKTFREALRAIVGFIFDKYKLPNNNGVDFGCGATGEMVEELCAPFIDKNSWAQIDLCEEALRENKKRHPSSVILSGSYLNAASLNLEGKLNIATGLSSLDASAFMARAIEQIRSTLKEGGYLLHIQDVRPGIGVCIQEMQSMGCTEPYPIKCVPGASEPLVYRFGNEYISVGELFRRRIGKVIENDPGMELLFNQWVTAHKTSSPKKPGQVYYMNMRIATPIPIDVASAVVTVAKKKI